MKLEVTPAQYEVLSTALAEMIADRDYRRKNLVEQIYLADAGWDIDHDERNRAEIGGVEEDLVAARQLFVNLELQSVTPPDDLLERLRNRAPGHIGVYVP